MTTKKTELYHQGNTLLDSVAAIGMHYRHIGRWHDAVQLYEAALLVDGDADKQARIKILLSDILIKQADYDQAESLLQAAEDSLGDDSNLMSDIWFFQAEIIYFRKMLLGEGDYQTAIDLHMQAFEQRQIHGEQEKAILSMGRLGVLYERMQDHDTAETWYQDAITLSEDIGYKMGKIRSLTHLAFRKQAQGEMDAAKEMFQQAVNVPQEFSTRDSQMFNIGNLALHVYKMDQDFEQAIADMTRAYEIGQQLDHKLGWFVMTNRLGDLYREHDQIEEAKQYYQQALTMAKDAKLTMLMQMAENKITSI